MLPIEKQTTSDLSSEITSTRKIMMAVKFYAFQTRQTHAVNIEQLRDADQVAKAAGM